LVSKEFADVANEKEEWYGTDFAREPLAPELLAKVRSLPVVTLSFYELKWT
jgi:hypothetical protein